MYEKIYNLQKLDEGNWGGDPSTWEAPKNANGVIALSDSGMGRILFTSNHSSSDFINYFTEHRRLSFKCGETEMKFFYGTYVKTATQTTEYHSGQSFRHAKSGVRDFGKAIPGDGAVSEAARTALGGISTPGSFGVGAILGPVGRAVGLFKKRYFINVTIPDKHGIVATVHNATSSSEFCNVKKGEEITFDQVVIALRDWGTTKKKKFGYGSVQMPD